MFHGVVRKHGPSLCTLDREQAACGRWRALERYQPLEYGEQTCVIISVGASQSGAKIGLCELRTPYSPEHPLIADGARKLVQGRCGGAKWILAEPRTVLQPRAEMEDRNEQFGSILDDLDAC